MIKSLAAFILLYHTILGPRQGTGAAIAQLGSTMGEVSDDDLLEAALYYY